MTQRLPIDENLSRDEQLWQLHEHYPAHFNRFWHDFQSWPIPIKVKCIHQDAKPLSKKRPSDIAWDVTCVADEKWSDLGDNLPYFDLPPFASHTFSTGIKVATPSNCGFLLRDRSGIGVSDVIHTAGVIEGTYRGEWKIHLVNLGQKSYRFEVGDRIVQAVLIPIIPAEPFVCETLPETDRGEKGFGSSGR